MNIDFFSDAPGIKNSNLYRIFKKVRGKFDIVSPQFQKWGDLSSKSPHTVALVQIFTNFLVDIEKNYLPILYIQDSFRDLKLFLGGLNNFYCSKLSEMDMIQVFRPKSAQNSLQTSSLTAMNFEITGV